jgi:hypothetical protein
MTGPSIRLVYLDCQEERKVDVAEGTEGTGEEEEHITEARSTRRFSEDRGGANVTWVHRPREARPDGPQMPESSGSLRASVRCSSLAPSVFSAIGHAKGDQRE